MRLPDLGEGAIVAGGTGGSSVTTTGFPVGRYMILGPVFFFSARPRPRAHNRMEKRQR